MSNEPGGPAPVPDPYAAPDPAATAPVPAAPPGAYEPTPPGAYQPMPPGAYEPTPPGAYGPTPPPVAPYGAPQYGAPEYGAAPQYGAPQYGAPQYGPPPQYGAPPQYGTPQYGAPGYDQPPPAYGAQPYGYGQPYVSPPTEGMAIASFVTSTAGLLFLGGLPGPVGLGLGIAALRRIKVSGKAGRGWAIAGIAIGAVGILWLLAIVAYFVVIAVILGSAATSSGFWDEVQQGTDESSPQADGDTTLPDFALRTDLTTGTCLTTFAESYDLSDTDPVACEVPHDAEVVGLVPMSGPVTFDAEDEDDPAYWEAWDACDQLTESLLPDYFADGDISLYYPHPDDFAAGTTNAYCVYYGDEPGMTGSATTGTLQLAGAGTAS